MCASLLKNHALQKTNKERTTIYEAGMKTSHIAVKKPVQVNKIHKQNQIILKVHHLLLQVDYENSDDDDDVSNKKEEALHGISICSYN
ncbi:hypothetical protein FQR65_LT02362 [Abscondita terminalis]|nr:hypothetical protein FQR65_LT02362 [Abscondita terminalis]